MCAAFFYSRRGSRPPPPPLMPWIVGGPFASECSILVLGEPFASECPPQTVLLTFLIGVLFWLAGGLGEGEKGGYTPPPPLAIPCCFLKGGRQGI